MKIIRVKHLVKKFYVGKHWVPILKDISFDINEGDFVSIMGPSGSGKTTLLYQLSGLDEPTKGDIYLNGIKLSSMSTRDRIRLRSNEIGFVFQFYNLVKNLDVKDNILLPIILSGKRVSFYQKQIDPLLDILGLNGKKDAKIVDLSGGQQQRVAIARALIYNPKILFLDEPIGNLDTKIGFEIMNIFSQINKQLKTTIVQVTHSPESALYGTHILYILDGELKSIKEISDLERRH